MAGAGAAGGRARRPSGFASLVALALEQMDGDADRRRRRPAARRRRSDGDPVEETGATPSSRAIARGAADATTSTLRGRCSRWRTPVAAPAAAPSHRDVGGGEWRRCRRARSHGDARRHDRRRRRAGVTARSHWRAGRSRRPRSPSARHATAAFGGRARRRSPRRPPPTRGRAGPASRDRRQRRSDRASHRPRRRRRQAARGRRSRRPRPRPRQNPGPRRPPTAPRLPRAAASDRRCIRFARRCAAMARGRRRTTPRDPGRPDATTATPRTAASPAPSAPAPSRAGATGHDGRARAAVSRVAAAAVAPVARSRPRRTRRALGEASADAAHGGFAVGARRRWRRGAERPARQRRRFRRTAVGHGGTPRPLRRSPCRWRRSAPPATRCCAPSSCRRAARFEQTLSSVDPDVRNLQAMVRTVRLFTVGAGVDEARLQPRAGASRSRGADRPRRAGDASARTSGPRRRRRSAGSRPTSRSSAPACASRASR